MSGAGLVVLALLAARPLPAVGEAAAVERLYGEWRHELMEAMREKAPERYREEVRHYYEELVR